jgi:beta-lactamase regulating signal transducer with metallopeptidase domain
VDDFLNIGLSNALAAALLALFAVAVGAFYRRPALTHGLWLLVLVKLVTPPLVRIPVAWPAAPEPVQSETAPAEELAATTLTLQASDPEVVVLIPTPEEDELVAGESSLPAVTATDPPASAPVESISWPRTALAVWLAGSLGWFALALARLDRFRDLLRHARPASARLRERTRTLSRRLGMSRAPEVRLLPGRLAPMLWAAGGKPLLLVPAGLIDRLDDEELDTLILHELAHLRRRDHWVRVLEFVVLGLYWWHPVVWYARRELREAEEQCCDAWVVSTLPGTGRTYASALLDTLDFLSSAPAAVPPLASGLGQISDLKRRLTMIMRGTTPRALSWPGCLTVLAAGAFFLPLLPALHAQTPNKDGDREDVIVFQFTDKEQAADLEKAKADLAAREAQLKQSMAEVARAKAALDAAEAQLRASQVQLEKLARDRIQAKVDKRFIVEGKKAVILGGDKLKKPGADQPGDKKPMIRIEIIVSPDAKHVDVQDLLKKIESLVSQKTGAAIQFRVAEEAAKDIRRVYPATKNVPSPIRIEKVPVQLYQKPTTTTFTVKPAAGGSPQEKRLSELEMKLEKVLKELQELRKQMKGSGSQSLLTIPALPPNTLAPVALPFDPTATTPVRVLVAPAEAPKKP